MYIYIYEQYLTLDYVLFLICHKAQPRFCKTIIDITIKYKCQWFINLQHKIYKCTHAY